MRMACSRGTRLIIAIMLSAVFVSPRVYAQDGGEDKLCLACDDVQVPTQCTTFVVIWENEMCTTERVLLPNGVTSWNFGYQHECDCEDDEIQYPDNSHGPGVTVCHECCSDSLCNRKLCGAMPNNSPDLACLVGKEKRGVSLIDIGYCNPGELCYAVNPMNGRPGEIYYECATRAFCDTISANMSPAKCQSCCDTDGCNAHVCARQCDAGYPNETTSTPATSLTQPSQFRDCWDLRTRGGVTRSGIYEIHPRGSAKLRVMCDMDIDGGGWIVLQRRFDGSVNFTRSMSEYVAGFGNLSGEFWLGLDSIHILTSKQDDPVLLRVDVCSFNQRTGSAGYAGFSIGDQSGDYRYSAGNYTGGTLSNRLEWHDGLLFQTTGTCADTFKGGWWYHGCYDANLNGGLYSGGDQQGIVWYWFGSESSINPSLKSSEMKIRPVTVTSDMDIPDLSCGLPIKNVLASN